MIKVEIRLRCPGVLTHHNMSLKMYRQLLCLNKIQSKSSKIFNKIGHNNNESIFVNINALGVESYGLHSSGAIQRLLT